MAARETAVVTDQNVVTICACAYVPHGIADAAMSGVMAATPRELVFVSDKAPADVTRHALDPARQPSISASRFMPGKIDFGDGRLFVVPGKSARAIKTALQREIEAQ
jgi:hypothetical protein